MLLPEKNKLYHFFNSSKITADLIIDALELIWPELKTNYNPKILLINADNGPENSSVRTRFIERLLLFSYKNKIDVKLAYYPPYHSKYNPIERTWAILENHWNGEILDSKTKAIEYAKTMTWNGNHPTVKIIEKVYETGVKVIKKIMKIYETFIERLEGLEKWFVDIHWKNIDFGLV
jgi:transposase